MVKTTHKSIKIFLWVFVFVCCLPLLQFVFTPLKLKGLEGAFVKIEQSELTIQNWNNSSFQNSTTAYLKQETPFRADFVRIKNQLGYWFFDEINTILTLGKENYIFDPNYIKAFDGSDFLPENKRQQKSEALQQSKIILDSLNIPMLFCIAPNKARFYQEYLPKENQKIVSNTNQDFFEKQLKSKGIPLINFDSWFYEIKDTEDYRLIPKYGAHWSTYGAALSGKRIVNKIDELVKGNNTSYTITGVETSSKAKFTDADYLPSLNLIVKWKSPELAYPTLTFKEGKKLNALIITDSFIWNFYDLEIIQNCFSTNSEVWYYNKTVFDVNKNKVGARNKIITPKQIKNRDVILFIMTGPSMTNFGYDFLEQLNKCYAKK